jgi:hypothetical protein
MSNAHPDLQLVASEIADEMRSNRIRASRDLLRGSPGSIPKPSALS